MTQRIILILLFLSVPAYAVEERLTAAHFDRVQEAKQILADVDARSKEDIIEEFNKTSFPEGNLQIYEAIAATYHDLVHRKNIMAEEEKKDLYNMIRLNVAFIQFGGDLGNQRDKKLNIWIRQALAQYLSEDLMNNRKLFFSADQWSK